MKFLTLLLSIVLFAGFMHGQTATVAPTNSVTILNTNTTGVPVHLRWGAITPTAGWTLIDYCIGESDTAGQEHAATTQGGIVYKGCPGHATGLTFDTYPFTGPHFWVVWAELESTDGTKVALSTDSNEASCDFEVLSSDATSTTFYCKDQVPPAVPGKPTGLTAVPQ